MAGGGTYARIQSGDCSMVSLLPPLKRKVHAAFVRYVPRFNKNRAVDNITGWAPRDTLGNQDGQHGHGEAAVIGELFQSQSVGSLVLGGICIARVLRAM